MNNKSLYPLTEAEGQELAAGLLTCSTIERYTRTLQASTAVTRLQSLLYSAPTHGTEFLRHAWALWSRVLEMTNRSELELPLAALMCVLGNSGLTGVEKLLIACSISRKPQSSWLAGLARHLLGSRSDAIVFEAYGSSRFGLSADVSPNPSSFTPYTVVAALAEESNGASGDLREVERAAA